MRANYLSRLLRRKANPIELLNKLSAPGSRMETIVHVGAHLAQERFAYEAAGYRRILWIEASPKIHARLVQIIAGHHERQVGEEGARHETLRALLTDKDGDEIDFREFSNDGMSSSIFAPSPESMERWPDLTETGRREHLRTETLNSVLKRLGYLETIDTLVVDVQGAELLVLTGAEETLSRVKAVVTEASTHQYYVGGVLFPELNAFLEAHGFTAMSVPRRHGDMLYMRRN